MRLEEIANSVGQQSSHFTTPTSISHCHTMSCRAHTSPASPLRGLTPRLRAPDSHGAAHSKIQKQINKTDFNVIGKCKLLYYCVILLIKKALNILYLHYKSSCENKVVLFKDNQLS
jgi:hypothetical protein